MKRKTQRFLGKALCVLLLATCILAGCTSSNTMKTTSVQILYNGEEITSFSMMNGTTAEGFTAVISPSDSDEEITWSSLDTGIVKVKSDSDGSCTMEARKTGSTYILATSGDVIAKLQVTVTKDPDNLSVWDTALTIKDVRYSSEECTMVFSDVYYDFVTNYGSYASNYGLDISLGVSSLKDQSCSYSDDGTWFGYFIVDTKTTMERIQALLDYATENNISLSEEELGEIDNKIDSLQEVAENQGYETVDAYLGAYYGKGITVEMYRTYLQRNYLANKVYTDYEDSLSYTDEEIAEHYETLGYEEGENDYPVVSIRHILLMAETNEDGEYEDAAIIQERSKAQDILNEYLAGEKTEEAFAALVEKYSEDSDASTTNGLIEGIYKDEMVTEINDWLFDESRKVGDTTIVDISDDSYTGTHILYFSGFGEIYSTILSREDLLYNDTESWMNDLAEGYTAEEGKAYSDIGVYD